MTKLKFKHLTTYLTIFLFVFLVGCKDDDEVSTANLSLSFSGLEDLGADYEYEGWLIVNGSPVSTGTFESATSTYSATVLVKESDLTAATRFVLTIEPSPDTDASPSSVHILAGDFSDKNAPLTVGHSAAIGDDFSSAAGKYILRTPTDGDNTNDEEAGVWWLDNTSGTNVAGLTLPTLPAGWKYEGWGVDGTTAYSTGTFTAADVKDDSDDFSSTVASGPNYPGEDFLMGIDGFPLDLRGKKIVVSIEPDPDNSINPFLLKPLLHDVPADGMIAGAEVFSMSNISATNFPTGAATR